MVSETGTCFVESDRCTVMTVPVIIFPIFHVPAGQKFQGLGGWTVPLAFIQKQTAKRHFIRYHRSTVLCLYHSKVYHLFISPTNLPI